MIFFIIVLMIRKTYIYSLIFILLTLLNANKSLADSKILEDIDSIRNTILSGKFDHAKYLTSSFSKQKGRGDQGIWKVKSNSLLSYIYKEEGDFEKAVIRALEAIRYANQSKYKEVDADLVALYNRCASIYKMFKSYELAEEYSTKALELSENLNENHSELLLRTKYNTSGLYRELKQPEKAIELLESCLLINSGQNTMLYKVLNRLTFTFYELKDYEKVNYYSSKIINNPENAGAKWTAFSYHIRGQSEFEKSNYILSQKYLEKALDIIQSNPKSFSDKKAEFEVVHDMGINSMQANDLLAAEDYFNQAEQYVPFITQQPEYFELYKSQADLHYELGQHEKSRHYENLYSKSLAEYLKTQEEIRATDQRYNMDLITKRYLAEIEKQEQIASIMMYSKIISGSLLFLLLAVIGYFRYEKIRLRRSIEKELIALKIIN